MVVLSSRFYCISLKALDGSHSVNLRSCEFCRQTEGRRLLQTHQSSQGNHISDDPKWLKNIRNRVTSKDPESLESSEFSWE